MKVLLFLPTLDYRLNFGCTPAWWQLMKAMHDIGMEVVVTAYRKDPPSTPWWKGYDNPIKLYGDSITAAQNLTFATLGKVTKRPSKRDEVENVPQQSSLSKVYTAVTRTMTLGRWKKHFRRIATKEGNFDAVIFVGIPLNQINGLVPDVKSQFQCPVLWYDPDAPVSLPSRGGFPNSFCLYPGADISEFDMVISNSKGSESEFQELGARSFAPLFWGVDADVFAPCEGTEKEIDVLFYGYGDAYRENAIQNAVSEPSEVLRDCRFVVAGHGFEVGLGRAELVPPMSSSTLRQFVAKSKICLNITRTPHGNCYGTSTTRIFEMAAMGCCIVTTPYLGVHEWFEPEKEIFIVESAEQAINTYQRLLNSDSLRSEVSLAARQKILDQHTYIHRAKELRAHINGLTKTD